MKTTTFFLLALSCAASVSARDLNTRLMTKPADADVAQKFMMHEQTAYAPAQTIHDGAVRLTLPADPTTGRLRAAAATAPITETPAGTLRHYWLDTYGYYSYWGYIFGSYTHAKVASVVFGDDQTVYLKEPITNLSCGNWLAGTVDGDTLRFAARQFYFAEEYEGEVYDYYVAGYVMKDTIEDGQSYTSYFYDPTFTEFKFLMRGDSIISLDGDVLMGLGDADDQWVSYGNIETTYSTFAGAPVEVPAGVTMNAYSMITSDGSGRVVSVGIDNADVYIMGLSDDLPEACVKGSLDGTTLTLDGGQYLGIDEVMGYYSFLLAGHMETSWSDYYEQEVEDYALSARVTFTYDAATGSFSSDSILFVNAGNAAISYMSVYEAPTFAPYTEVAATPASPTWGKFTDFDMDYGYGYFVFYMSPLDVEGHFIDPAKLYYNVYYDGDVLTFDPETYTALSSELTDVPYAFTDSWDIYVDGAGHTVYYYEADFDHIGLQTIYKGGGEVHKSPIVYYGTTALEAVAGSKPTVCDVNYHDLTGAQVMMPGRGIYVKSIRYTDGTVRTVKVAQ